jgi:hypothetical protein
MGKLHFGIPLQPCLYDLMISSGAPIAFMTPWSIQATREQSFSTVSMLWVTNSEVT